MRVLFVHECFGALAGAEANLAATAASLKQRGHAVGMLHGPPTGRGDAVWRELFYQRFPLGAEDNAPRVEAALGEFEPDVVYIHKMANLEALEALLAGGTPLVRMVHDHDLYCMRSYRYNVFSREICTRPFSPYCVVPCGAFVARNGDDGSPLRWVSYSAKKREIQINQQFHRLVVATSYMKEQLLINGFDPAKIEIHAPVPRGAKDDSPATFSDRNLLLFAGQIIRGKGVDVLLESLALVREPFECAIFGDGNHREHCEQLSRKRGLAGRVHFRGYVPQDELRQHYREASVMVLSSVWPEPFGAVGLEGMRHGLPVVAFDAGGIKEWLLDGQNGFLVPWMDCAKFATRVDLLLRDKPLARQMGERGRQLVTEHCDFGKYISGLEEMFGRVITGSPQLVNA
jgi:glycosyltransferase involved in cell wall biosynthesis